jgi:Family of unknown function (DUF6263)
MISRRIALAVAGLAAWSLTAAAATAQTTLRYKFKEGETLKYVLEQKMKMNMDVMGNNIEMNMNQTSDMTWSVGKVDDKGNAKITVKFGRQKMSMKSPMGNVDVDSNNSQEPDDQLGQVLFKVVKALAGMEVSGTLSPLGEYSDVVVPEKALKEFQDLPGSANLGDMFSPEGIKRMMSQSGLIMPKEAISKGKTWKSKTDMKLPIGKMIAEVDYTYGGPEDKDGRSLEKIALKPKATLEPDPNSPIVMKLKAHSGTGAAYFDNEAGRLQEVTNQQTMEMEADVMGMAFTQKMVMTMTMRLAK